MKTRRFLHTLDSILKGTIKVKVPFPGPKSKVSVLLQTSACLKEKYG